MQSSITLWCKEEKFWSNLKLRKRSAVSYLKTMGQFHKCFGQTLIFHVLRHTFTPLKASQKFGLEHKPVLKSTPGAIFTKQLAQFLRFLCSFNAKMNTKVRMQQHNLLYTRQVSTCFKAFGGGCKVLWCEGCTDRQTDRQNWWLYFGTKKYKNIIQMEH